MIRPCPGCDAPLAFHRQLCDACRDARRGNRRPKSPNGRSKWHLADGVARCQRGRMIAGDADIVFTQGRRRCRACHRDRNRRSAATVHAAEVAARAERRCIGRGVRIAPNRQKFCSLACARREHSRIQWDRERAAAAGVAFEPVNRLEIYERDGWTCQLCTLPVSWFLSWPHDWSPVLDHRIPLALGGGHVASNVQLAHAICNAWKRDLGPAGFERALLELGGADAWGLARA